MRPLLLLLTMSLAASGPLHAQRAAWDDFTRAFDAAAREDGVVGGSVRLVLPGEVRDHQFGVADRGRGLAAGPGVIQHWASITKTLTAIAIMQLRDEGRLALGDPIVRYVPELAAIHADSGRIEDITIGMVLTHTGGFRGGTWPYGRGASWEPFEPTEWSQLVAMFPYTALSFQPGARYGYSNPGYVYLARVIEHLTGDPWEEYVHKNILAPLGLDESSFRTTPWHLAERRSANYTVRRGADGAVAAVENPREFDPGITVPNSGWNAPITDLTRYARFLMGQGEFPEVLARATLEEMWGTTVPAGAGEYNGGAGNAMGLGFFVHERNGRRVVGHTGFQAGFRSFLFLDPQSGVAVIGVWNTDNAADAEASGRRWEEVQERARGLTVDGVGGRQ